MTRRPLSLVWAATLLFPCAAVTARAQGAEEEAIKRVIRAETESYYGRKADAWQATWVQDSTAVRTMADGGAISTMVGWAKFGPGTADEIRKSSQPVPIKLETSNYAVHAAGGVAWAEYDQRITTPRDTSAYISRELRGLVKRNGEWKIVSAATENVSSFGASPGAIENRLNGVGYSLLGGKKVADAIEVFKLNVRLFPNSWNVYDSLGEAYAAAGDTKLAIENYEKSVALNPKNDGGKAALAKLKGSNAQ